MDSEQHRHLEEHGWVVIPGVVEQSVCDEKRRELFSFLQKYNPALKLNGSPGQWKPKNMPPGTLHGGMNRCAGHLQSLWDLRQHPGVTQVFADLYKVAPTDLVTSMDAWTIFNAKAVTDKMRDERWLHFDQGPQAMPQWPQPQEGTVAPDGVFNCVQGYVTLEDADEEEDGGLFLVDRGHTLHSDFFANHAKGGPNAKGNWHRLTPSFLKSLDPKRHAQMGVKARKGDMVLWYSTTPHQGRAPSRKGRNRAVVYICHGPKALLTQKDVHEREVAWNNGYMTSHWPCVHAASFPHKPLQPGKPKVKLTELGWSLLGLDREQKKMSKQGTRAQPTALQLAMATQKRTRRSRIIRASSKLVSRKGMDKRIASMSAASSPPRTPSAQQ